MTAATRAEETRAETPLLEERIRVRAYELYLERGDQSGSEVDDWVQAEREILETQEDNSAAGAGA